MCYRHYATNCLTVLMWIGKSPQTIRKNKFERNRQLSETAHRGFAQKRSDIKGD
jgi:hypothetical protein